MTTIFITRHQGAIQWAKEQGVEVDRLLTHLEADEISQLTKNDTVLGILPVNLACEVCKQGARYYHLALDLPPNARGVELTAEEMTTYGAKLIQYHIEER